MAPPGNRVGMRSGHRGAGQAAECGDAGGVLVTREPRVSHEHLHRLPAAETGLSPTPGRLWVGPIPPSTCGRSLEWALAVHPPKCRAPTGPSAASLSPEAPAAAARANPQLSCAAGRGAAQGRPPPRSFPSTGRPAGGAAGGGSPSPGLRDPSHIRGGLSVGPSSLPRHHPHRARGCLGTREVTEVARALPLRSAGRAVPRP